MQLETLIVIPMTFSAPTILSMVGKLWQMHFRVLYLMCLCRLHFFFSQQGQGLHCHAQVVVAGKGIPMSSSMAMLLYKFIMLVVPIL